MIIYQGLKWESSYSVLFFKAHQNAQVFFLQVGLLLEKLQVSGFLGWRRRFRTYLNQKDLEERNDRKKGVKHPWIRTEVRMEIFHQTNTMVIPATPLSTINGDLIPILLNFNRAYNLSYFECNVYITHPLRGKNQILCFSAIKKKSRW